MAFAATVIWEVQSTGSNTNGGGFDPTSGVPGTDFSQQTAAQITYTDLVIDATTNTKCTSAGNPFTSAHVGNIINVTSGTGFTVQRVQVLSVAAGVATCDKSLGTLSSTGGNGKLGGCLATPAQAALLAIGGNTTYIKATATYSTAVPIVFGTSGAAGSPISWIGYTTTRTDGGQVTFRMTAGGVACTCSGGFNRFFNIIADDNAQGGAAFNANNQNDIYFNNCKAMGGTQGFNLAINAVMLVNCVASGNGTNAGFFFNSVVSAVAIGCRATANTVSGFTDTSANGIQLIDCIADNNTGASSDGFQRGSSGVGSWIGCVAYKNGRDGFRVLAGNLDYLVMRNCISVSNTGQGLNSVTTSWTGFSNLIPNIDYNAYFGNAAAYVNVLAAPHDVTLTVDPFTNGASNDFSLNNTAGGGAACRAAGFPGALQSGGTGKVDIGALQHGDPAGSSGMLFVPNMEAT